MDGNNNHNTPQYPYNPYYYHPQYYTNYSQQQHQHQHVPQGDPSAALSSMMYQLQQQTQQRQAMGALAAASISNTLGNNNHQQDHYPPVEYYADYYAVHDQRSMINYNDITHASAAAATANVTAPSAETTVNENDPSPKKPKFCCNRWLKSAIAVAQHEKLHIQCPSCDHMCLKSALQEHEEIAHGKERIETNKKPSRPDGVIPPNAPRIDTPEELAAWIAARKKNWPSKDNVERKEQEMAEKEARGELSVNNKKRKANDRNKQPNKKIKTEESSLVDAQYDSDSDSDDIMDPERDAISSKDPSAMGKILLPEDKPKRRCKYFMMGKCKRGDECGFSHEKPEPRPKQPKNAPVFKKRPNLLFKLLEKDIMQEKSVILQCLRYIADNKFFGKGGDAVDVPLKEESNVPKIVDEKEDSAMDTSGVMEETLASSAPVEQSVEAVVAEEKKAGEEVSVDQEQTIAECDTAMEQ